MKRLFVLGLASFFFVSSEGQNLVPNWSFEDSIQCPTTLSELNKTQYWFNPTTATPDYFNSCNTSFVGIPSNAFGYQNAHTGNAYTGCYYGGPSLVPANCREYIEIELTDSLVIGKSYNISFYVSLANNCSMGISNVGCYLSQNAVTSTNTFPLPVVPQIENPVGNYLLDTLNWMNISGTFIALGGEKFLTIGNFRDDATTDSIRINQNGGYVYYYYIDDVSIIETPDTTSENKNDFFIPNAFSPNGDGNNDVLFVRGRNIQEFTFNVFDRWGQMVFETQNIDDGWDGTYNGKKMENAVFVYYLMLTYEDGNTETKKGNISLIR